MTPEATKAAQQIAAETGLTVDQVVERSLLLVATLRALTLGGFTGFTGGRP